VKAIKVTTSDGQVHVFEGDKDEIDAVKYKLDRVRRGMDSYATLVNREGKKVYVFPGCAWKGM
jgi:hypothetical protein